MGGGIQNQAAYNEAVLRNGWGGDTFRRSSFLKVCISPQMCVDESPLRKAAGTLGASDERQHNGND